MYITFSGNYIFILDGDLYANGKETITSVNKQNGDQTIVFYKTYELNFRFFYLNIKVANLMPKAGINISDFSINLYCCVLGYIVFLLLLLFCYYSDVVFNFYIQNQIKCFQEIERKIIRTTKMYVTKYTKGITLNDLKLT